jgi:hypothetical protein
LTHPRIRQQQRFNKERTVQVDEVREQGPSKSHCYCAYHILRTNCCSTLIFVSQHTISTTTNLSTTMIHQFTYQNAVFYNFSGNVQKIVGRNSFVLSVLLSTRPIILRDSTLYETVSTAMTYMFAYRYTISHN